MKRFPVALTLLALLSLSLLAACSVTTTPAPAPAPRAANDLVPIVIESSPNAAEVWIDGAFVGTTNMSYHVAPGKRVIELRKEGLETWRRELTVREGSPTRVRVDLKALPR